MIAPADHIRTPRLPMESRRRLKLMELRDGRVNLVDAKSGKIFAPCANKEVAKQMRAAFAP